MADSVTIYGEGSFYEQIQDLVNYLARSQGQEIVPPFQEALQKVDTEGRRNVLSLVLKHVSGFGDGSDKEIQGFFNLLFAHLLSEHAPPLDETLPSLLTTLESSSPDRPLIQFQILTNLFNALPRKSPFRPQVYNILLRLASAQGSIDLLSLSKSQVEQWLSEWPSSTEEKSLFLKSIIDAYISTGQPMVAYEYLFFYVCYLSESDPPSKSAALDLIATALRLPMHFQFDTLLAVNAVVATKDHPLFSLLHIFLNQSLTHFQEWIPKHSDVLQEYNLVASDLERKMRLLVLAGVASQYVGTHMSYSTIASTLDIPIGEVEKWVIEVIRCGLLSGKLSQTTETLFVTRSTARTFGKEQWEVLESRLVSWKKNLAGVLETVAAARKQAGASNNSQLPGAANPPAAGAATVTA